MRIVRSQKALRWLVAVMIAALLPSLAAPAVQAMRPSAALPLADWLRDQLRSPADDAFEAALAEAVAAAPGSLDAFLSAFAEAYQSRRPGVPLADVFAGEELAGESLIEYLHRRYHSLSGDAVLPRTHLTAAAPPQAPGPDRPLGPPHRTHAATTAVPTGPALTADTTADIVVPLRVRSAAQPLGP